MRHRSHLHKNGVLSLGGFESQLIEGHDLSSGLEDALAGVRGDVHGAERQLGKLVDAQVVGDGADNHGGLVVTAFLQGKMEFAGF